MDNWQQAYDAVLKMYDQTSSHGAMLMTHVNLLGQYAIACVAIGIHEDESRQLPQWLSEDVIDDDQLHTSDSGGGNDTSNDAPRRLRLKLLSHQWSTVADRYLIFLAVRRRQIRFQHLILGLFSILCVYK